MTSTALPGTLSSRAIRSRIAWVSGPSAPSLMLTRRRLKNSDFCCAVEPRRTIDQLRRM